MEIIRIDDYQDQRFSQKVLFEHGCFLVDDFPYEIEIISDSEAIIKGKDKNAYQSLIEEFRFYSPHITVFYDHEGDVIEKFPKVELFSIAIDDLQPSQFYVDEQKIKAISNFINKEEDIIIQACKINDKYVAIDGHTRLYYAYLKGWKIVRVFLQNSQQYVNYFVEEAQKRRIFAIKDMKLLKHQQYQEKWYKFCDEYFSSNERKE